LPVGPGTAQWPVWGTTARLVVTDPARLFGARKLVVAQLAAVEQAASRFRDDSEVRRLQHAGSRPVRVSALLAELVAASLVAARRSDGDVDPTVGAAMRRLGYDRDLTLLPVNGGWMTVEDRPAPGWRSVRLDGRELTVPAGVLLDLGATAKACTADRCARIVASRWDIGVLVSLGGNIATAGPAPGRWLAGARGRPAGRPELYRGAAIRRRAGHVEHGQPAVAAQRSVAASHSRPAHLPAGAPGLAQRLGRRRPVRRSQHAHHGGGRPRARRTGLAASLGGTGPAGDRRSRGADRRRLARTGDAMNEALWYLGRGTGVVSLILLTTVVVLGVSGRSGRAAFGLPRFAVAVVHRNASLLAVAFLAVHVTTLLLDPYAQLRLVDLVRPFGGAYRPLWLGFGTLASDLVLALVVTSLLRHRLGLRAWRAVHWAAYAAWPVALLHALGNGSDNGTAWLRAVAATCAVTVLAAVCWRLATVQPTRAAVQPARASRLDGAR